MKRVCPEMKHKVEPARVKLETNLKCVCVCVPAAAQETVYFPEEVLANQFGEFLTENEETAPIDGDNNSNNHNPSNNKPNESKREKPEKEEDEAHLRQRRSKKDKQEDNEEDESSKSLKKKQNVTRMASTAPSSTSATSNTSTPSTTPTPSLQQRVLNERLARMRELNPPMVRTTDGGLDKMMTVVLVSIFLLLLKKFFDDV